MKRLKKWLLVLAALTAPRCEAAPKTVLLFVVDGVPNDAMQAAIAAGAANFKYLRDHGVWVDEVYCPSPAARDYMPDGSLPWKNSSAPNVAMHTGTHIYDSRQVDDIFLAARRAGLKSVFAGGAENYEVFTTADFHHSGRLSDDEVVRHGVDHLRKDGVRLIRLHLQEIRDAWTGPADRLKPDSPYQRRLARVDRLLGDCITALKLAGCWQDTYVIATSDHGMGQTKESDHPSSVLSSWKPFLIFYGPGLKRGERIPYAETPDIAIMVNAFLGLPPLAGFAGDNKMPMPARPTGTFLANIFEGGAPDLKHPALIRRYLESRHWAPPDEYADYRAGMLALLNNSAP